MTQEEVLREIESAGDEHLYILWTNADLNAARLMVFMYAENSLKNGWWKKVTVIVWGATTKLVAGNKEIQEDIKRLKERGIHFSACISCAEELGLEKEVEEAGIDLIRWGKPLTELIKNKKHLLTV